MKAKASIHHQTALGLAVHTECSSARILVLDCRDRQWNAKDIAKLAPQAAPEFVGRLLPPECSLVIDITRDADRDLVWWESFLARARTYRKLMNFIHADAPECNCDVNCVCVDVVAEGIQNIIEYYPKQQAS